MAESIDKQNLEKLFEMLGKPPSAKPNLKRVFQKMIDPPYKGKVLFSHMTKMSPDDFTDHDHTKIIRWFRGHPDKFAVFEGDNGRIAMVAVRVKNARLCWKSNKEPIACTSDQCMQFHICQKYIEGDCTGSRCHFDHHFQSDHSRMLLKQFDLEMYKDEDLLTIFRQSQLQVCNFYDRKGTCDNEDRCTKIHICADLIRSTCFEHCPKKLKHDFDTPHSHRLLRIFNLHDQPLPDLLSQLLIVNYPAKKNFDLSQNNQDVLKELAEALFNFAGKQNEDAEKDKDALQLKPYLRFDTENTNRIKPFEETKKPISCHNEHKKRLADTDLTTSIMWEIEIFGNWVGLDQTRNRKLEEAYCNPRKETNTITLPDVEECFLSETIITVDFNTMSAILQKENDELKLRRRACFTDSWLWYFETDDKSWMPYPEDDQVLLESGYMINQKRVFVGEMEKYRVKFSDLTQRNRETGRERRVRRRPFYNNF